MLTIQKKLLLSFICGTFVAFIFFANVYCYEVQMKADTVTYEQDNGIVTATGNVQLDWLGKILKADNIEIKIPSKQLDAQGNVSILESSNTIFTDTIHYDMEKEQGEMTNTFGCSAPIFFRAEKMYKISSDTYKIENVTISNCDLDIPHHYAYAKHGLFIVDKKITISNAIYYIGGVPVFYFPKYTRKLNDDSSFRYDLEPGYSNEGGGALKLALKYRFTKEFDSKLSLDYLGSIGNGVGLELSYNIKDKVMAGMYSYGTIDKRTNTQRWMFQPSYWQRINQLWTVQAHAEFQSDSYFNNMYQQDNWNRVSNQRRSYLSATRQSNSSNLRVLTELYQVYNIDDKLTSGSYFLLPQVYYSIYPQKISGITNNLTFNFENRTKYEFAYSSSTSDFNYQFANLDYNATKDYRITKKFTLKPTIGIREDVYSKKNPDESEIVDLTRLYASLNARYRLTGWMDWNLAYNLKYRLQNMDSSFLLDSASLVDDGGFESNTLLFNNYIYLTSSMILRNYTGYDFRNLQSSSYKHWYPLINELTYVPSSKITVYMRQQQDLDPVKFNSLQLDTKFGQLEKFYFTLASFYYDYRPESVDLVTGIGFWINSKWRVDYNIRNTCKYGDMIWSGNDHEFKLYRDMHCFNLGSVFRLREDYWSLFFKFELKSNVPTFMKKDGTKEVETEFYPWR
ncbi:MAG: hypothetical protein PHR82_01605 [Endomicrobiaceae bacterium]|nr:hypothetical protein [Endomicrobiaceae bacterium]